jgi:hypothetical protein
VDAFAERQMVVAFTQDVECMGILELCFVTVRGGEEWHHPVTGFDGLAADLCVESCDPKP